MTDASNWRAFCLPPGREPDENEREEIARRSKQKASELMNEEADSTFIEFLITLVSAGLSFQEVSDHLQDVLVDSDKSCVEKLCEWLANEIKVILNLSASSLESEETVISQEGEANDIEAIPGKKAGISLQFIRETAKRRIEEQKELAKSHAGLEKGRIALAQQYKEYLESGFVGDFLQFQNKNSKISNEKSSDSDMNQLSETPLNPEAIAQRREEMSWEMNPNPSKVEHSPLSFGGKALQSTTDARKGEENGSNYKQSVTLQNQPRGQSHFSNMVWTPAAPTSSTVESVLESSSFSGIADVPAVKGGEAWGRGAAVVDMRGSSARGYGRGRGRGRKRGRGMSLRMAPFSNQQWQRSSERDQQAQGISSTLPATPPPEE